MWPHPPTDRQISLRTHRDERIAVCAAAVNYRAALHAWHTAPPAARDDMTLLIELVEMCAADLADLLPGWPPPPRR